MSALSYTFIPCHNLSSFWLEMLTWSDTIQAWKSLWNVSDPLCRFKDGGAWLLGTNHFPGSRKTLQNNLFTAQQALHCHWVPRLNWMVHRLLNYFYIPAFHGRLKAYYWRDWDHRNLLHVWPFKAFHRDGSQVRIYWNQFLSESSMLAHRLSPVWNIHFIKKQKEREGERGRASWLLEMGKILKHPKCLCVLSSQIKETLK